MSKFDWLEFLNCLRFNGFDILDNDFASFGVDDGSDQQLLAGLGVLDHFLDLLDLGGLVVLPDEHFLDLHFFVGNVFADSHFLCDLLDGLLQLGGRMLVNNGELLLWHILVGLLLLVFFVSFLGLSSYSGL
jgi:hypothetical protein